MFYLFQQLISADANVDGIFTGKVGGQPMQPISKTNSCTSLPEVENTDAQGSH